MLRVVERSPIWLMVAVVMGMVVLNVIVLWLVTRETTEEDEGAAIPITLVTSVVVTALVYAPQTLLITSEAVRIRGLYVVRVTVPRSELTTVVAERINPLSYGGIGVRAANGALAFVSGRKPAVLMKTRGGRRYVFTTLRAADVVAELVDR